MITRIGAICQDQISLGFLQGLRIRLDCEAELIEAPPPVCRTGKEQLLKRKDATAAWRYFQKKGVDLIVRFTDADGDRWQNVCRDERKVIPTKAESIFLCAVAVESPEDWLCLDTTYLAKKLDLSPSELANTHNRTGTVKRAIARSRPEAKKTSDFVADIVREAPHEVFRQWLQADNSLRAFYTDCQNAAKAADCVTRNELDSPE